MQAPERIPSPTLADYLEVMSKSAFQAGISWKVVESKWPSIREAFRDFDPQTVADFTNDDVDELAKDTRVIRNRRKLAAIVENARTLIELDAQHSGFQNYLRSHDAYDATSKDIRKRFKFLGDTGIYHFLFVVNEQVPSYEEFRASIQK